jgi:hypothetical protein
MPKPKTMSAKCVFPGCDKKTHAFDLCHGHAKQYQRGKPLVPLLSRRPGRKVKNTLCEYQECENISILKGLCRKHYIKLKRELKKKDKTQDGSSSSN